MGAPEAIVALARDCALGSESRRVLLLRLDALPSARLRAHHLPLAERALAPLFRAGRSRLFRLPGPRLAVAFQGAGDLAIHAAIAQLRIVLEDVVPHDEIAPLLALFDLPHDGDALLDALTPPATGAAPGAPLDIAALARLEPALAQADVARFVRRLPVWRIDGATPVRAWEERRLDLAEIAESLAPGFDLAADGWLLRRLLRTLERRMLTLLSTGGELLGPDGVPVGPFALRLRASSVNSAEFMRFDDALPAPLRGKVLLSLAPEDACADFAAFSFARDFARMRGYRIVLHGVTPELTRLLDIAALDPDLVELTWQPGLTEGGAAWLAGCSRAEPVLGGCNIAALVWARSVGIRLTHGPALAGAGRDLPVLERQRPAPIPWLARAAAPPPRRQTRLVRLLRGLGLGEAEPAA